MEEEKKDMILDDEQDTDYILDDVSEEVFQDEEKNDQFERKCDIVEAAIESAGMRMATDKDGKVYGIRGHYLLNEPIIVNVDRMGPHTIKMELHLFHKNWEEEGFDFEHFYEVMSDRCYISLQNIDNERIEYRMIVPNVSLEILPEVMTEMLKGASSSARYFNRMRMAYEDLYC